MPKVGNRSFTYDSKGYKDATKYAKDTGQEVVMKKVWKKIVFDVIESTDYITKAEIKDQVLDYAVKNKILTK